MFSTPIIATYSSLSSQNIGPSWVLFNLAGLYWRVAGNGFQGVECIRRALHTVPEQYRDVPLVNLANVLYRWGRHDDAVVVMQEALKINDLEVSQYRVAESVHQKVLLNY